MSKYNLIDILEGMSNDEWEAAKEADRLEAHPDRDKIKAIQAMIAKERENRKKDIKEMTGETYRRIDGLVNRVLLQQFLIKFSEIYEDMVEGGDPFDVSDVIQFLTSQMHEFADDTRMNVELEEDYTPGSGWTHDFDYDDMLAKCLKLDVNSDLDLLMTVASDLEDVNYHREAAPLFDVIENIKDGNMKEAVRNMAKFHQEISKNLEESTGPSDKSEPEDDVDNVDYLASPDAKANDYSSAVSAASNQDDLEGEEDKQVAPMFEKEDQHGNLFHALSNFGSEVEIKQYLDSVSKDMLRTPGKNDYEGWTEDDYIEDFKNYIADKALQEHFGRFLKDYQ